MRIEFQARARNRRNFRHGQAAAAILALLAGVLASGNRLLTAPFELAPRRIDFGMVRLGSASPLHSVEVRNRDTKSLRIETVGLSGNDLAAFNLTWNGCKDTVVPPQGVCRIGVFFATSEPRHQFATLSVSSGESGGRRTVDLTGSGEVPPVISIRLVPSSVQVGGVRVGSGADRDVTIVNTGNAPAPLGQAQIAGDHWNDFHIVDDKCSNRSLAERECRIRISFIPTEAGTHQAVVVVPYNGGRAKETAWIGGSASPPPVPVAALQPARVELTRRDFEHSIELRNMGDGRLTVTDIAVGGKNPEDFEVDRRDCLHWALPSGGSCVMAVTFQADMAKRQRHKVSEATLMVQDNAAGGPQTVVLIGREGSTDHKKIILEIIGGVAAVIGVYEATHGHGSESGTPTNRPTPVPISPVTPSPGPIQ